MSTNDLSDLIMKIWIMHDTQFGNGKALAELMANEFPSEYDISVGDVKTTSAHTVVQEAPQLLILGGAIRMFFGATRSRKWLKKLSLELRKSNGSIPFGTTFLTHGLSLSKVFKYGERMQKKLAKSPGITNIFSECFMARVADTEGPFIEGELDKGKKYVKNLLAWMQ